MSEEILAQSLWNAMKQTDTVLDQANKEIARLRAENERLRAELTNCDYSPCIICTTAEDALDQANEKIARMRGELAVANERVAQLEASQDWEPFDDWIIDCDCPESCGAKLYADDGMLQIEDAEGSVMIIHLPDNVRLQRRRPQSEGQVQP